MGQTPRLLNDGRYVLHAAYPIHQFPNATRFNAWFQYKRANGMGGALAIQPEAIL